MTKTDGDEIVIDNPAELPPPQRDRARSASRGWTSRIVCPDRYIGAVMELVTGNRGEFKRMEYLQHGIIQDDGSKKGEGRVLLEYHIPLSEILVDFYDQLKSRTQGYASLDYTFSRVPRRRRS